MNELRIITLEELVRHFPGFPKVLGHHARASVPLFAGYLSNRTPFCVVGLIPTDDSHANLWGWNTPLVAEHSYIYARWSRQFMREALAIYPTITGFATPNKRKWIESIGGRIVATASDMFYFEATHAHP